MFLNRGDETQERSLKDPWELTGDLLFDPQVLLDTIMMKGGTLAPLYTNAATFYRMNNAWWNRHKLTFQKWWEVIDDEYTPLWDRDGFEETTDQTNDDGSTSGTRTSTEVMDDDTSKQSTTKEVINDDTSKHSTTKEVMDDNTTSSETGKEVFNGTDKRTTSNTEVIDDSSTSKTTTSSNENTTTSSNSTTNNYVSAFDSGYDAKGNPIYQPHDYSHTVDSGSSNTESSGTSTVTAKDDRTTTNNGTDNLKTDSTTDTTKSIKGTDDRTTDTTYNETGTDDRTTDTTYNETGTDDRTTNFDEQTAGTSKNTRDYTHQHHSWGNWGITTTAQKLLEQELRIRAFDIYEHMADFFLDELCVRVYL